MRARLAALLLAAALGGGCQRRMLVEALPPEPVPCARGLWYQRVPLPYGEDAGPVEVYHQLGRMGGKTHGLVFRPVVEEDACCPSGPATASLPDLRLVDEYGRMSWGPREEVGNRQLSAIFGDDGAGLAWLWSGSGPDGDWRQRLGVGMLREGRTLVLVDGVSARCDCERGPQGAADGPLIGRDGCDYVALWRNLEEFPPVSGGRLTACWFDDRARVASPPRFVARIGGDYAGSAAPVQMLCHGGQCAAQCGFWVGGCNIGGFDWQRDLVACPLVLFDRAADGGMTVCLPPASGLYSPNDDGGGLAWDGRRWLVHLWEGTVGSPKGQSSTVLAVSPAGEWQRLGPAPIPSAWCVDPVDPSACTAVGSLAWVRSRLFAVTYLGGSVPDGGSLADAERTGAPEFCVQDLSNGECLCPLPGQTGAYPARLVDNGDGTLTAQWLAEGPPFELRRLIIDPPTR